MDQARVNTEEQMRKNAEYQTREQTRVNGREQTNGNTFGQSNITTGARVNTVDLPSLSITKHMSASSFRAQTCKLSYYRPPL